MKTIGMRIYVAVIACLALGMVSAATFVNGGFEDGTTTGWTGGGGTWSGGWPLNFSDYVGGTPNNTIVTPGNDPYVGSALNRVFSGNYALRLNDNNNNQSVSTIQQTIVNYTDTNMFFAWAAVLQGSHGATDSDNFTLQLRDDTAGSNLIFRSYSSASGGSIFTNYGGVYATAWQIEQLDVSASIGHTFTISVLASDCPYGGHWGYAYIDAFGNSLPSPTPPAVTITANVNPGSGGSATGGGTYDPGTNVVLMATPSNGWGFLSWSDGDTNSTRTVLVASNMTYTANFGPTAVITVTVTPPASGSTTGSGTFFVGSNDVLTTTPATHWRFLRWNDGTRASPYGLTVPATNTTYTAHFAPDPRLFFQHPNGDVANWLIDSNGTFVSAAFMGNVGDWVLETAGDINGDGISDLLFDDPNGDQGIWFLNADGSVNSMRQIFPNNISDPSWKIAAAGDWDGIGHDQVFWQNPAGDVVYWVLDTNGNFQSSVFLVNAGGWKLRGAGYLFMAGDTRVELVWQDATGQIAVWYRRPDSSIGGAVLPYNVGEWALHGVVDIDGDGVSDLIWQHPTSDVAGWFMNSGGTARAYINWGNTTPWKLKAGGT